MAEDFEFFSTDYNNWNFNIMMNKPDLTHKIKKNWIHSVIIYINIIYSSC